MRPGKLWDGQRCEELYKSAKVRNYSDINLCRFGRSFLAFGSLLFLSRRLSSVLLQLAAETGYQR